MMSMIASPVLYMQTSQAKDTAVSIALIDFYADGHHGPYLQDLVSGLNKTPASVKVIGSPDLVRFVPAGVLCPIRGCEQLIGKQGIRRQWVARELFGNAITQAMISSSTHIHFLYTDWHVSAIATSWRQMQPLPAQPVLTVHWSTGVGTASGVKDKLRRYPHRLALRWLVDRAGACVLVHHESVAIGLSDIIDHNHIYVVPYPSQPLFAPDSIEKSLFRASLGLIEEDTLMLCFGDTRFDKGADLAVQMLKK
ncbi:MAG: hypothetical protein G3I10_08070, partial [Ferrovum sp.]|nr:hypothetical protein [Ferrovum sp.]